MTRFPNAPSLFCFDFPPSSLCLHWHMHLFWSFSFSTQNPFLVCFPITLVSLKPVVFCFHSRSHRYYCAFRSCVFLFALVPWVLYFVLTHVYFLTSEHRLFTSAWDLATARNYDHGYKTRLWIYLLASYCTYYITYYISVNDSTLKNYEQAH